MQHRLFTRAVFTHVLLVCGAAIASITAGSSCALDPVHDSSVKALGEEDPEWPQGPYHRAGQPCTVCHGGQGPAKTKFLMAGTIFATAGTKDDPSKPVNMAQVRIRDSKNLTGSECVFTNCRGNFYVTEKQFPDGIYYPVKVAVSKDGAEKPMNSLIGREPSCAVCHKRPGFFDSPGQVYLYSSDGEVPPGDDECTPDTPVPEGSCN